MVLALANVDSDEDIDALIISNHREPPRSLNPVKRCWSVLRWQASASTLQLTCSREYGSWPCPHQRSPDTYRTPVTTPPGSSTPGAKIMPGPTDQQPQFLLNQGPLKGNGGKVKRAGQDRGANDNAR